MIRKIIDIDRSLCNGCGLCIDACHEKAIVLVDGKAELVSDEYCDGLGDCLPECPTGAIRLVERESKAYDEEKVEKRRSETDDAMHGCHTCPGSKTVRLKKEREEAVENKDDRGMASELTTWPVQLMLVNPRAGYFEDAHILIAADCTAYAYGDFHREYIKDKVVLIGCPKLDDAGYYRDKLTEILKNGSVKSITVVRMEVPCCAGIVNLVKNAILESKNVVPYSEIVIGIDGEKK